MTRYRRVQAIDGRSFDPQQVRAAKAVSLAITCDRLGISKRTGERLLRDGRFPIPELPRLLKAKGSPHRFSTLDIDQYLMTASTAHVW
jgi:hypothetical protein